MAAPSTPSRQPSLSRRPTLRSTSVSSTWSTDVPHHHEGTSYFPPVSPSSRRNQGRSASAPRRSVTHHSDEEDGDDEESTPGENDQDDEDAERNDLSRQFNDEDPLTVKDRQSLMNVDHPFGLPIWKPALYKKSRTVNRNAEDALHSVPSAPGETHINLGNVLWILLFGWWLGLLCVAASIVLTIPALGVGRYSSLLYGLGWYICWPFNKYVEGSMSSSHGSVEEQPNSTAGEEHTHQIPTISEEDEDTSNRFHATSASTNPANERTSLLQSTSTSPNKTYGIAPSLPAYPPSPKKLNESTGNMLEKLVFWWLFTIFILPVMLIVCLLCWFFVFFVPMAKLTWELIWNMISHPDDIRFCTSPSSVMVQQSLPEMPSTYVGPTDGSSSSQANNERDAPKPSFVMKKQRISEGQAAPSGIPSSTVLLCTYKAAGLQYYKYTVGGVNIFFVNLMAVVFFVIFDANVLLPLADSYERDGRHIPAVLAFVASRATIFGLSLTSVIPLSYFIGMAVASISAQSSIGMGAVINATFGSIIEIVLYALALTRSKGRLVEGSIVGSLLAGVLLMPGASMCSNALVQKEQKFNAKSASVTSTMLIMAIIGTLAPTMFYQTYGNFQLVCNHCPPETSGRPWSCDNCYYEHPDPINDPFYQSTVKTFMYFCAAILLLSYLIGLWFSLRTHASQIWQNPQQLMHPLELRVPSGRGRMSIYDRILQTGFTPSLPTQRDRGKTPGHAASLNEASDISRASTPTPTRETANGPSSHSHSQSRESEAERTPRDSLALNLPTPGGAPRLVFNTPTVRRAYPPLLEGVHHPDQQLHGISADDFTRAVAVATVSALRHQQAHPTSPMRLRGSALGTADHHEDTDAHGGHDAPSWSRTTSASVLLACTALYAAIADILVDVVDVVLEGSGIDEKFLGVTLFALVPNTTEFLNAMSFAMNGNIALSMEIGSAYALQVCLLQIPAMVAFSAWYDPQKMGTVADTFTLIFPRWDVIAIILSIFLMTYTYIEARSNYHRGSILVLSYIVLTAGFYFAPQRLEDESVDPPFFLSFLR